MNKENMRKMLIGYNNGRSMNLKGYFTKIHRTIFWQGGNKEATTGYRKKIL